MGISHRENRAAIVAVMTLLTCLGLLWKQSVGGEPPRIIDGSNVTLFYQLPFPARCEFEVREIGRFVRDDSNCRQFWNGSSLA